MSRYGEDGETGYAKENLFEEMDEFLKDHAIYELLKIVADVVDIYEYRQKRRSTETA